jgi:hypothetical protein
MTRSIPAWVVILMFAAGCTDKLDLGPTPAHAAGASRGPDASTPTAGTSTSNSLRPEISAGDPRSESVKLKLWVLPVTAEVVWGAKKLGTGGREPLELERPRNSGPLDIVVRAPGYLPFHTRLLTDRDDALTVRLVTPAAAPGLLGYKRMVPETSRP